MFHDAYSYFNDAYGLNQTGYFTINPLVAPGAKTIAHIKEEIEEHHVNCLLLNLNSHQKWLIRLRKVQKLT